MGWMAMKTERFAVRLTAEQDALIRRAAEIEGTDLTNFTVTATLAHAREVLADRGYVEAELKTASSIEIATWHKGEIRFVDRGDKP